MATDSLGVEIEVNDWVLSMPKSGNVRVGRVSNVSSNGRVTIEVESKVAVYAWERGAPDLHTPSTRIKRDEDGNPVRKAGGRSWEYEYEEYDYVHKDYTVVARRWGWAKHECAWYNRIVVRKKDGSVPEDWAKKISGAFESDLPA